MGFAGEKEKGAASLESPENAILRNSGARRLLRLKEGFGWNGFLEAQIWGQLPLNKSTVKEIRLRRDEDKLANDIMEKWAREQGISVNYF
jgi:hypothetical protein